MPEPTPTPTSAGDHAAPAGAALSGVDPTDPGAVWRALGAAGTIEALYADGVQPDPRRLSALLTELDARCPLGVTLSVCVQVATVLPLLAGATGPAERARRGMLRGETVVALAVTDAAGSGSDLLDATTRVKLGDDGAVLDGGKDWITNATSCDAALVLARHREARHFTSFCWVLAPADAPGVTVGSAGRAFAGSGVGHLRFAGVALGPDAVLGRPGRALAGFARQVGVERVAGALWARAMCHRMLAGLRDWLRRRPAGAGTLWDRPAVRERYARCLVATHQLDALCAPLLDAPAAVPSAVTGMLLKVSAAETVDRVAAEAVRLRGADAFRDGGEAQLRTEAAMFGIAGGATGAMLAGIADHADELAGAVT
ncbi:alkylation response protein AidB-like acyl-CoA dehydrogenase [Micromonospora sp. HB375]|uniref:acyl-CoA dehydrogenase family protein n=1 Tax=Micromonospora TaxID=1873 RepID=UPI001AE3FED3|nr:MULTISPECIES: acyl-CoA dehydrogenase family protein [unclassified Micromonospora]MBP1783948.1 alkylation response protein AidB-like acyl-CoA dehydrogenase [Micromonospora sp. HB375]MDH6470295.1 acyl-CoA dehydrogenase [Micromonospora sp. H404/HB375]